MVKSSILEMKVFKIGDGANLYATAKSLGFDIDYSKRFLREFQSRGDLLRAFY